MNQSLRLGLFLLTVWLVAGCQTTETVQTDLEPRGRFEIRLAQDTPGDNTTAAAVKDSGKQIFLHQEVLFSGEDLISANALMDEAGRPAIGLAFTKEATVKLADVTRQNIGRRLAVIVDGGVLQAPVIRDAIVGGNARITGNFTEEETRKYVELLNGNG